MSENESKIEIYELGAHLSANLEDKDLELKFKELQKEIERYGGHILSARPPQKQRLSYPIKHQRFSFLGFINFRLPAEALRELDNHWKLREDILRFLVVKTEENQKILKSVKEAPMKARRQGGRPPTATKPIAPPSEKVRTTEMEKQIEEVIEKI